MKRTLAIFVVIVLGIQLIRFVRQNQAQQGITIGVIQTAAHPALDAACAGFIEECTQCFGSTVRCVTHNAQGSLVLAHTSAQSFHDDPAIAAIFAIGTLAAQAAGHVEKKKPIFFAAVTDPKSAGLLNQSNMCGTSDMIDAMQIVALAQRLVPALRSVVLLFNATEINATVSVARLEQEFKKRHIVVEKVAATNEAEMLVAAERACTLGDAIVTPLDNTVATTITALAAKARIARKPLIVSDVLLVKQGALAAVGVDYFESGKRAASLACAALKNGQPLSEISTLAASSTSLSINKPLARELGIVVDEVR